MEVIRETNWIREWKTSRSNYLDSKYRSYECDASADEFIITYITAQKEQIYDLEVAFEFFFHIAVECERSSLS